MVRILGIIVFGLAAIMVVSTVVQFHRRKITPAWAMFWSGLWVVGSVLTFFTGWLDRIAERFVGVEGRFIVVYGAIIFLLFITYRLFMRQQDIKRDISMIVEEIAKKDAKKGKRK